MCRISKLLLKSVIFLTPLTFTACFSIHHIESNCKSHAYIDMNLQDYVFNRFPAGSSVRLGIIPFSVPANLTGFSAEFPSLGRELARHLQAQMLRAQAFPISEVLNREDWPGKKDEFFAGNYQAISLARDSGYDFVFVGFINDLQSAETLSADIKLIEVESGITVWYGKIEAFRKVIDKEYQFKKGDSMERSLDFHNWNPLTTQLASCIGDEFAPETE